MGVRDGRCTGQLGEGEGAWGRECVKDASGEEVGEERVHVYAGD